MGSISCCCLFLLLAIIVHSCWIHEIAGVDNAVGGSKRNDLEIIIGGGAPPPENEACGCTTPSPPPPNPPSSCLPQNIIRDYNTIQKFRNRITCDPMGITNSWNQNNFNVCQYEGFVCDYRPDSGVLSLAAADFNGYNFNGPDLQLNDFLDELKDLAIFHANSNNFTGIFPQDISVQNINFFYELDLSNNKYTGGFPKQVLAAKNLTFLDIRFNNFYGSVPKEVFTLDLDVLFLNNNQFSQQLPDNVGSTPALYLTFANNHFTGCIPSSIGRAKNLLEVLFLGNQFTGCLPYEIGYLSKATVFDVSCNSLTGPIPHSFACLAKMQILNLASNEFYGPVPEMVCKLPNLQNLSLSNNYFTQVGPECRKLIWLKRLDVRMNCILDLPNQRSAAECRAFFSKHRQCPNEKSLTYIPCSKNGYSAPSTETLDQQSKVAATPAPPPRSYHALSPENKLRF